MLRVVKFNKDCHLTEELTDCILIYQLFISSLLTQEEQLLEDNTKEFFNLAFHTHYPDSALISFYWTGLNKEVKAKIPFPSDGQSQITRQRLSSSWSPSPSQSLTRCESRHKRLSLRVC